MYLAAIIYTNAGDLARMIEALDEKDAKYRVSATKGIDGETVAKLEYRWVDDEEED